MGLGSSSRGSGAGGWRESGRQGLEAVTTRAPSPPGRRGPEGEAPMPPGLPRPVWPRGHLQCPIPATPSSPYRVASAQCLDDTVSQQWVPADTRGDGQVLQDRCVPIWHGTLHSPEGLSLRPDALQRPGCEDQQGCLFKKRPPPTPRSAEGLRP